MRSTLILLLVIALGGCTAMQTVNSQAEVVENTRSYRYYDSESQIRYQVSNNEKFLFLTFNTTNKASIMKVIETGLTIYFDVNGKKKQDTYIQYPLARTGRPEKVHDEQSKGGRPPKMNISHMISMVPRAAVYFTNESRKPIDLATDTSGLEIDLHEENGSFTYAVKIPFSKISNSNYQLLTNLSIGVESGEFEEPAQGGPGQGGPATQSGARPSGVPGGGGGQGRGSGGQGNAGGGPPGGQQSSAMTTPIAFWFKVNLFY